MWTMRVLIAGAAGFLGSHLTDALIAEGNSVIGIDNLCTGSLRNLRQLEHEPKFEFVEQDICRAFDPKRVDYVFNFASPASPVDYLRLGVETLMVGSAGTRTMGREPNGVDKKLKVGFQIWKHLMNPRDTLERILRGPVFQRKAEK